MPAPTPSVLSLTPSLRVFRRLDADRLSNEFIEKIGHDEGSFELVDADRARDLEWTQEIMDATIGAALIDSDGNVLAEWDGSGAVAKAYAAKSSAKITFSVDLGEAVKRNSRARAAASDE